MHEQENQERPYIKMSNCGLAELLVEANMALAKVERTRLGLDVIIYPSSQLKTALDQTRAEDVNEATEVLSDQLIRVKTVLERRITGMKLEFGLRDYAIAMEAKDDQDAGFLREKIAKLMFKLADMLEPNGISLYDILNDAQADVSWLLNERPNDAKS